MKGYGLSGDAYHITAPSEDGDGGFRAMRMALKHAGMAPDQMEKLFQPFVQGDASTSRKFGGTGLGMTITHRFCEMMGGKITAASETRARHELYDSTPGPGHGSTPGSGAPKRTT